jgi:carboxylate-amine ligase
MPHTAIDDIGGRGAGAGTEARCVRLTLGVEEEFLLVDARSGDLVPRSREVLVSARGSLGDSITSELNLCQIELASGICTTLGGLAAELAHLRHTLAAAAARRDVAPLASGTHPYSRWQDQEVDLETERYVRMVEKFQLVAREQTICGLHVHVAVEDPDLRIATMTRIRPWLPVLLALSANSPFWQGVDSGYASYRTLVWQRWPTARMPPALPDRAAYDALVERLVGAEAIDDASYLYWYVRPSRRFPTIELRVCDVCLDVDDAVAVAGLVRALVWMGVDEVLADKPNTHPTGEVLRSAVWRAARYGIDGTLLDPTTSRPRSAREVVRGVLEHVRPGLEAHDDWALVHGQVERILERGTGAAWQRRAAAEMDGPTLARRMAERTVGAA